MHRHIGIVIAALCTFCIGTARAADFALQQIAPGDYVHFGVVALERSANPGDIANLGANCSQIMS